MKYNLVDKLILRLQNKLTELTESDVLLILRSFKRMKFEVVHSTRLFTGINNLIVDSALQNQENVTFSFLLQYLGIFYELPPQRDLTKEQRDIILNILEKKV